jgi:hypothetical protein
MINTVIPNALAAVCFFIAGFYYKNEMEELQRERDLIVAAALLKVPALSNYEEAKLFSPRRTANLA